MGRSPLIVKKDELQKVINDLEASRQFRNQQELFLAVQESDWGKNVRNANYRVKGIKAPVVYNKIREFDIVLKTPKGKKGRTVGQVVNRTNRSEKMAKNPEIQRALKQLRDDVDTLGDNKERLNGVIDKIEGGSIVHAVRLKCMECRGYEGTDYKQCNAVCPLRPVNLIIWPRDNSSVE